MACTAHKVAKKSFFTNEALCIVIDEALVQALVHWPHSVARLLVRACVEVLVLILIEDLRGLYLVCLHSANAKDKYLTR